MDANEPSANVGQIKLKVVEGSGQTPKYLVSATTDVYIYKVKAAALKWCIRRKLGFGRGRQVPSPR